MISTINTRIKFVFVSYCFRNGAFNLHRKTIGCTYTILEVVENSIQYI